jgi:DNA-binding MarR family transcriptional regulator
MARDVDVDFGIVLGLAYQAFTDALRADLAARGYEDLGSAYGYVFRALAAEALHQNELARRLGMTAQGMYKIIGEMVARGYVERAPDPEDGRANRLRLAARGRAALAAARRFHSGYERRLRAELGESRVDDVRRVLTAMVGSSADGASAVLRAF